MLSIAAIASSRLCGNNQFFNQRSISGLPPCSIWIIWVRHALPMNELLKP
jgi:hypothetical protein